jgi:hypothetical protein
VAYANRTLRSHLEPRLLHVLEEGQVLHRGGECRLQRLADRHRVTPGRHASLATNQQTLRSLADMAAMARRPERRRGQRGAQ